MSNNYSFPIVLASLSAGNQPLSDFELNFDAAGRAGTLMCSATGTNSVTLTSLAGYATMTALGNYQKVGFIAVSDSTTLTTLGYSGLAQFNAYLNDGVTQVANQIAGFYYEYAFNAALNSAVGGWQQITANAVSGVTTNSNAAAGFVGEYIASLISSTSLVSLATNTTSNVTSITLTPGDWDVNGSLGFGGNAATVIGNVLGGASNTSATPPANEVRVNAYVGAPVSSFTNLTYALPPQRFSLATLTALYLTATARFSGGTLGAYGVIQARRTR